MRIFAVILIVAIVAGAQALNDEQKEKIKEYHTDCLKVSHVDKVIIEKMRNGNFVDDVALKTHLFCFSKKMGFQNEAGELQKNVIKEKLQAEIEDDATTEKLLGACLPSGKITNPPQAAWDIFKCYYEKSPNHHILA